MIERIGLTAGVVLMLVGGFGIYVAATLPQYLATAAATVIGLGLLAVLQD